MTAPRAGDRRPEALEVLLGLRQAEVDRARTQVATAAAAAVRAEEARSGAAWRLADLEQRRLAEPEVVGRVADLQRVAARAEALSIEIGRAAGELSRCRGALAEATAERERARDALGRAERERAAVERLVEARARERRRAQEAREERLLDDAASAVWRRGRG